MSARAGAMVVIAAKPNPVDHPEKIPRIAPAHGINIGSEAEMLLKKIPSPSMFCVEDKNS